MRRSILILLILLTTLSCKRNIDTHANLKGNDPLSMAILYNYYSSEYKALSIQAYKLASNNLRQIAESDKDLAKMAVVVDIDETVLDNSPYQAKAIVDGFSYPAGWNEWCMLAQANPVPGSVEFLNLADKLGFRIFYVSNRKEAFVKEGTHRNLIDKGFPQVSETNLMLREEKSVNNPDPSDKQIRRDAITAMGLEIVMLVGDNIGDFYSDSKDGKERDQLVIDNETFFGSKYIVLPNAMYGNWPAAIGVDGTSESVVAKLKEMAY